MSEERRRGFKILTGKHIEKRPLGKHKCRLQINIGIDLIYYRYVELD